MSGDVYELEKDMWHHVTATWTNKVRHVSAHIRGQENKSSIVTHRQQGFPPSLRYDAISKPLARICVEFPDAGMSS
jgi:hypothetical protein